MKIRLRRRKFCTEVKIHLKETNTNTVKLNLVCHTCVWTLKNENICLQVCLQIFLSIKLLTLYFLKHVLELHSTKQYFNNAERLLFILPRHFFHDLPLLSSQTKIEYYTLVTLACLPPF